MKNVLKDVSKNGLQSPLCHHHVKVQNVTYCFFFCLIFVIKIDQDLVLAKKKNCLQFWGAAI
jgi:hypothetical protein